MAKASPTWKRVRFGEVVRLVKETCKDPVAAGIKRVIGLEHIEPGDLRVRSWADIADGTTFTTRVRPGQVLFGKRRAYQRKVAVAHFDAICSGDIYVFESANPERLLPELLPFVCQTDTFFEYAVETSAGSLSPRTNWSSLAEYEFALPSPVEQRRLCHLLTATRTVAERYQDAVAAARNLLTSSADFAFGRLEAPMRPLGDIADVQYGLTINALRRNCDSQRPYLRVANVQRGFFDLKELKLIGSLAGDERFVVRVGDLLVVEGHADRREIGRAALWQDSEIACLHQNHLMRVRLGSNKFAPEFVLEYMNASPGRRYFSGMAKSTSGLFTINSTVLRAMPIPDASKAVQETIVDRMQALRKGISLIETRAGQALKRNAAALNDIVGRT